MKESSLQRRIIAYLRGQGCYVFKVVGSPLQQRGTPDLLACCQGRFLALEIKVPGEKATPLQEHELKKIQAAGGAVQVCTSLRDVQFMLFAALQTPPTPPAPCPPVSLPPLPLTAP